MTDRSPDRRTLEEGRRDPAVTGRAGERSRTGPDADSGPDTDADADETVDTDTNTGLSCAWDNGSCEGTVLCPPRCPRFTDREGHPMLVRPYDPADRNALVAMYDDLDGHSRAMGLPPATVPKIDAWLERLIENGWNLLALDGEQIAGHVAVVPVESADPEFVIFVHQDYQNRGVGSELIKQLLAHADERAHSELRLSVSTGNRRAITVYQNVGFDVVEREVTELAMALDLEQPVVEQVQLPPAARN